MDNLSYFQQFDSKIDYPVQHWSLTHKNVIADDETVANIYKRVEHSVN